MTYAAERLHAVVHEQHGGSGFAVKGIAFGKHGGRAGLHGRGGKVVTVRAFADNGHEQVAFLHFAVVGTGAAQQNVGGIEHLGMGGFCGRLQRHQHETSSLSIS